jgi:N-acetylglucosaminyldiphosphoundecaprenol N-acetyl-beta-D-mannosaminyltransferase
MIADNFDYHAGNIKRAPGWMQKLSLEWLYRLLQDPKRLFKRYLVTNTRYLWLIHRK